jgi:hypothetical protein
MVPGTLAFTEGGAFPHHRPPLPLLLCAPLRSIKTLAHTRKRLLFRYPLNEGVRAFALTSIAGLWPAYGNIYIKPFAKINFTWYRGTMAFVTAPEDYEKVVFVFLIVLMLFSCSRFPVARETAEDGNRQTHLQGTDEAQIEQEKDWLIIGGKRVRNWNRPRDYDYYLKSEIENITSVELWINPKQEHLTNSLEGIEQLVNLRALYLHGRNMDTLDYSPLSTLPNITGILFESGNEDKLTKVSDLSGLASRLSITWFGFEHCALTSMDNIEFLPNLKEVVIAANLGDLTDIKALNQLIQLEELRISSNKNSTIHLEEIPALAELKTLILSVGIADVKGIEKFSLLDSVNFHESDVVNTEFLSGLQELRFLEMTLGNAMPDMKFLGDMRNLKYIRIWVRWPRTSYPEFDLGPIGTLSKLEYLELSGFSLKNVSVLDNLEHLENIFFMGSVLNDESETSTKDMVFIYDGR